MADYVSLAGVRTWYDEHGDGDPLVLLHPGGGGVDSRLARNQIEACGRDERRPGLEPLADQAWQEVEVGDVS